MERMSSGFPTDVLQLLCLSAAFYLADSGLADLQLTQNEVLRKGF